jgi:hypothetical protein
LSNKQQRSTHSRQRGPATGSGRRQGEKPNDAAAWQRAFDRYVALARAALSAGDRIEAENFYQHAEHYFRLMRGASTAAEAAPLRAVERPAH